MKLRNKRTGELLEDVKFIDTTLHKITIQYLDDGVLRECTIKNLSDIEEVKDYEEPKEYWFIGEDGCAHTVPSEHYIFIERIKEIGNYFEAKEEAEQAVRRLKAWKRLKGVGFKFTDWHRDICKVAIEAEIHDDGTIGMITDLDLLFGGEG